MVVYIAYFMPDNETTITLGVFSEGKLAWRACSNARKMRLATGDLSTYSDYSVRPLALDVPLEMYPPSGVWYEMKRTRGYRVLESNLSRKGWHVYRYNEETVGMSESEAHNLRLSLIDSGRYKHHELAIVDPTGKIIYSEKEPPEDDW